MLRLVLRFLPPVGWFKFNGDIVWTNGVYTRVMTPNPHTQKILSPDKKTVLELRPWTRFMLPTFVPFPKRSGQRGPVVLI